MFVAWVTRQVAKNVQEALAIIGESSNACLTAHDIFNLVDIFLKRHKLFSLKMLTLKSNDVSTARRSFSS